MWPVWPKALISILRTPDPAEKDLAPLQPAPTTCVCPRMTYFPLTMSFLATAQRKISDVAVILDSPSAARWNVYARPGRAMRARH
jgi:hypothetical protein